MAKTTPPTSQPNPTAAIHKLPRLPKGTKIHKRPLLHPAIASPRSALPKTVYISASSPFISSLKRVRKYLAEIDRQERRGRGRGRRGRREEDDVHGGGGGGGSGSVGPALLRRQNNKTTKAQSSGLSASTARGKTNLGKEGKGKEGGGEEEEEEEEEEEVLIKATGKAIEKALRLALYFQGQEDCVVRLRTGTVGAIDDLAVPEMAPVGEEVGVEGEGGGGDDDGVPETRLRRTSMLEVGVSFAVRI